METTPNTPPPGIMLCDDLIFFSRVAAAAKAAGLTVRQAKTQSAALALANQTPPGGVIIDLQNDGLNLTALLAELKTACRTMPTTIGFGSHVDAETLRDARKAGCDRVMPRSQFVEELDSNLTKWFTPQPK